MHILWHELNNPLLVYANRVSLAVTVAELLLHCQFLEISVFLFFSRSVE